jgi:hypothetical protein
MLPDNVVVSASLVAAKPGCDGSETGRDVISFAKISYPGQADYLFMLARAITAVLSLTKISTE